MKDIQVTLYDVFGYIFPGAIFLAAMSLGYWTAFLSPDQDLTKITGAGWILILMVAYVSGHLVQALANLVVRLRPSIVDLVLDPSTGTIPAEVVQAAQARARALIGSPKALPSPHKRSSRSATTTYSKRVKRPRVTFMFIGKDSTVEWESQCFLAPALIALACLTGPSITRVDVYSNVYCHRGCLLIAITPPGSLLLSVEAPAL